jgi:hypothetical protein
LVVAAVVMLLLSLLLLSLLPTAARVGIAAVVAGVAVRLLLPLLLSRKLCAS